LEVLRGLPTQLQHTRGIWELSPPVKGDGRTRERKER
jgi:hypothetical protein